MLCYCIALSQIIQNKLEKIWQASTLENHILPSIPYHDVPKKERRSMAYNNEIIKIQFTARTVQQDRDNAERYDVKADIDKVLTETKQTIPFTCRVIGYFLNINEGDTFEAEGTFVGYKFYIKGLPVLQTPATIESIISLGVSQIKGVKERSFQPVVEYFGVDVIDILAKAPERILEVKGVTRARRDAIVKWCAEHACFEEVLVEVLSYGLSPADAVRIYRRFGGYEGLYQIQKNPYALVLYDIVSFKKIDSLAFERKLKDANSEDRLKAVIWSVIKVEEGKGNVAIVSTMLERKITWFLKYNSGFPLEEHFMSTEIKIVLDEMISSGILIDYPYQVGEKTLHAYYRKTTFRIEKNSAIMTAEKLQQLLPQRFDEAKVDAYLSEKYSTLTSKQKEAVHMAIRNKISILTGGPGCGKTFTLNAIIHLLESYGASTLLMAPTGKAAVRMMELTNRSALTIHSALKIMPNSAYNEPIKSMIEDDWVIVDEVSMMDARLWYELLRHISPKTNILLCGDVHQLPSIGYGDVLSQLINNKYIPSVELDTIFRQGAESNIVKNASIIRTRDPEKIYNMDLGEDGRKDFEFIEATSENCKSIITKLTSNLIKKSHVNMEDVMVLTPMHKAICGTIDLNIDIQAQFDAIKNPIAIKHAHYSIHEQDRVIVTKNQVLDDEDKTRIYNGEMGYITDAFTKEIISDNGRKKTIEAVKLLIDNHEDEVELTDIDSLLLSYAITIHKAQGSEASYVIVPFLKEHGGMLTNKLIYTALTRAKVKFIAVGEKEAFFKGCLREDQRRISLLSYMVRAELENQN